MQDRMRVCDRDGKTTYEPFIDADTGVVGWRCIRTEGVTYIYMVPSGGSDDGVSTVFVYQGSEGDPLHDEPMHHYVIGEAS